MKFVVEIVVRGIDYPSFRRVYYSEEFNGDVAEAVKLKERIQLEHDTQPDGKERRRVRVVPRVSLPAAVQKLLNGQPISYEEITVFDPATRSATFAVETPAGETVQVTGLARFHEEGGGSAPSLRGRGAGEGLRNRRDRGALHRERSEIALRGRGALDAAVRR